MSKLKTIFVCAIMVLMTTSTAVAYDDAAANLDAGNNSSSADEVPSLAIWYDGDLSDNDISDHYFWANSLSNDMHIIIVSGSTNVDYTHTMPSGHQDSVSLSPNSFSVRQLFVQNNTTSLDFYFSQAGQGANVYCFAIFDQASSQYDWNALNQSSSQCDGDSTAPNVNVVGTDLGGGDYVEGGDLIEVEITYTGYISGYTVYWYDDNLGELTEIDYTDVLGVNRSSSVISVEALNYDSGGDSASVIVCPSGKQSSEPQDSEGPCDKSSPIAVRPKANVIFDCSTFNNMGGPDYVVGAQYMSGDIVEYPQGSMEFWYSIVDYNQKSPSMANDWIGPCNCTELGYGNLWSSSTTYPAFSVVEYDGGIWISIDLTNEEPNPVGGPVSNQWIFCTNLTAPSYDDTCGSGYDGSLDYARPSGSMMLGSGGPAWDMTMGTVQDQIYEYPAGSGVFWIARQNLNPGTAQEPGVGSNSYEHWLGSCNCSEIWTATGGQHYYPQGGFAQFTILEYPQSSGVLWISLSDSSVTDSLAPQEGTDSWRLCYSDTGGGGNNGDNPCDKFNGFGGPVFGIGSDVQNGEIFEYPSASGLFYMAIQSYTNLQITPDSSNGHEVWEGPCNCTEIWSSTMTTFNPNTVYSQWEIVDYNNQLYISTIDNNNLIIPNVEGWLLCGPTSCQLANGFGGPYFRNSMIGNYHQGDIVEWPAGSGNFWISQINNNPFIPEKESSDRFWVKCTCAEIADGTSFTNGQTYDPYKIVEHNNQLYMRLPVSFVTGLGDLEPGVDKGWDRIWRKCKLDECHPIGWWNAADAADGIYDVSVTVRHLVFSFTINNGGLSLHINHYKSKSLVNDNSVMPPASSWGKCPKIIVIKEGIPTGPGSVSPPPGGIKDPTFDRVVVGATVYVTQDDSNMGRKAMWVTTDNGKFCWNLTPRSQGGYYFSGYLPDSACENAAEADVFEGKLMDKLSFPGQTCDEIESDFQSREGNTFICVDETVVTGGESITGGCWENTGDGLSWRDFCGSSYKLDTFDVEDHPPIVTGTCQKEYLQTQGVVIDDSSALLDVDGHLLVQHTRNMQTECGAVLTAVAGDGDDTGIDLGDTDTVYTYSLDGVKYNAMNFVGLTCEGVVELPGYTCSDTVVITGDWKEREDETRPNGSENETRPDMEDDDGDGVPNEWDKCPETPEDAATDKEGCEVDIKEAVEDSGLPGFTAVSALVAITMAVAFLRRRLDFEEI